MSDEEIDKLLREALIRAASEDADALLKQQKEREEKGEKIEFSRKYKRFRKKLLKDPFGYAKRRMRPKWKTFLYTFVSILLVCVAGFGAVMAVSSSARAGVMQWIRTVTNADASYDFIAEPANEELPRYEVGALPEGYAETERSEMPKEVFIIYKSEDAPRIDFRYVHMEDGTKIRLDTEEAEISHIEVNGCEGNFYYFPDGTKANVVVWIDEAAEVMFTLNMWADKDELLRVAESVYLLK